MRISFVRPKIKYIIAKVTKIWWFYFLVTAFILVAFYMFLKQEIINSNIRTEKYRENQKILRSRIKLTDEYFERLIFEATLVHNRADKNKIRRDKLADLLYLIPDKITLHSVELDEKSLTLKGVTPSKEFFYFALQDPLKANFGRSSVSFYALSNGWYEFISISTSIPLPSQNTQVATP